MRWPRVSAFGGAKHPSLGCEGRLIAAVAQRLDVVLDEVRHLLNERLGRDAVLDHFVWTPIAAIRYAIAISPAAFEAIAAALPLNKMRGLSAPMGRRSHAVLTTPS
jgi:hypothetical protein